MPTMQTKHKMPVVVPYIQTMEPGALLQDDNARPHRARIMDAYLQQQHITRIDWPACSPDINPIEHVWDKLGKAVQARLNVNIIIIPGYLVSRILFMDKSPVYYMFNYFKSTLPDFACNGHIH